MKLIGLILPLQNFLQSGSKHLQRRVRQRFTGCVKILFTEKIYLSGDFDMGTSGQPYWKQYL